MTQDFFFSISRVFEAPRDRVWKAWTDGDQLQRWFGPKGCPLFQSNIDLRAGGLYHYGMKMPDGSALWGRWLFRDVVEPERLVFIASFSSAEMASVTRNPWNENWPLYTLSTVTLDALGNKTRITLTGKPVDATAVEMQEFEKGAASMNQGWTGTLDQLEAFLA